MPTEIVCPSCDVRLQAPPGIVGRQVKCKNCGTVFVAGGSAPVDKPPPPPAPPRRRPVRPSPPADDRDEPEDEPPRRRRRRIDVDDEPPRSEPLPRRRRSRGRLYLILGLTFGMLLLLTCVGGGLALYFAYGTSGDPSGWAEYHDPVGGYRVKFPKDPKEKTEREPVPGGGTWEYRFRSVDYWSEMYMTAAFMVPNEVRAPPPDLFLDHFATSFARDAKLGAVEKSRKPIAFQGYPGRELVLDLPEKKMELLVRIIAGPKHFYLIAAASSRPTSQDAKVAAFFGSFKID
jgi:hypothetical protein